MHPLLSLAHISIDPELARRLPRRLAYYHLALPIAEDEAHITVAMAYPGKSQVVAVLETVLGAAIMPVRSHPDEIQAVLDQIWRGAGEVRASTFLTWTDKPDQRPLLHDYALGIEAAFGLHYDASGADAHSLDDLLQTAQGMNAALIVAAVVDTHTLEKLLHEATTSVLVMRGSPQFPKAILQVLRGHTPDRYALDWIVPLAHHFAASVTLLAAASPTATDYRQGNPLTSDFANLMLPNHPTLLSEFGQVLASVGISGHRKIRQGALETVIVDECASQSYDLMVMATEAYGAFVYRVVQSLTSSSTAFLIVKP